METTESEALCKLVPGHSRCATKIVNARCPGCVGGKCVTIPPRRSNINLKPDLPLAGVWIADPKKAKIYLEQRRTA